MSSPISKKQQNPEVVPRQTMRGHTNWIQGVVHLPGGQRIITSSRDGSLRLWDLESGAQIGEDWRDDRNTSKEGLKTIALSPNGNTVASGSDDGKVSLWNVKTGKVIARWTGHNDTVGSVCWSADGERVVSGYHKGTVRVWDVKRGTTVLTIKTGHMRIFATMYSPDGTKIATCGYNEKALNSRKRSTAKGGVNIWHAKTGKLLATLEHNRTVFSVTWTSDGKKLISASERWIGIFDTATWKEVAINLMGHPANTIIDISLSRNDRLLASTSRDNTARLWNLDTNLPVGPPLQHKDVVECASFSIDGGLLVTSCHDKHVYVWEIHAILQEAGLEDLLSIPSIATQDGLKQKESSRDTSGKKQISHSSQDIDDKSFLEADATRCPDQLGGIDDELTPGFFDDMRADVHSSATRGAHSSASALLSRLSSLLHRSRPENDQVTELPQPPRQSALHPHVLLGHLSSLIHRSQPDGDGANEFQQPPTPLGLHPRVLLGRLSSLLPRAQPNTDGEIEPRRLSVSSSDAFIGRLFSLFRSPPDTNEEIELVQHSMQNISSPSCSRYVVEVAACRDKRPLVVRRPLPVESASDKAKRIKNPKWWVRIVLFLCCVSPGTDDGHPST